VLFVAVPLVFILTAAAVTPDEPITLTVRENARTLVRTVAMPSVHGATMAPIAIASLSALIGLFVMVDSRDGDRRAVLAGLRPSALFTARLAVLGGVATLATSLSLATTALVFDPVNRPAYVASNLLLALTFVIVGALLGPLFGRVGGVFIAFLVPFLDLGIAQSPMLHQTPTAASRLLPGYGGSRVLLDGALTSGFDEAMPLLIGLSWLTCLLVVLGLVFRRSLTGANGSYGVHRSGGGEAGGSQ
jgi:hypothetical protein